LTPAELRAAIIDSTDMLMIDYSDADAMDILLSDPHFEILRQTRHTSLILFSGGANGVFFTCRTRPLPGPPTCPYARRT
jgi:hypothetical protein